jgi:hypothetical protein
MVIVYVLAWVYVLPMLGDEYQFFARAFLLSLPILLGISELDEVQDAFISEHFLGEREKKKVVAQLVDLANQSTIALVYPDGSLDILSNLAPPKKKQKQKQKKSPKNKKDWYNSLSG